MVPLCLLARAPRLPHSRRPLRGRHHHRRHVRRRRRRAPGRRAALMPLRPFDHCLPFALQGRRRRRGLSLAGSRGLDHRLCLGLELAPEFKGRVQGGPQGGENDF